ncbi:thiol-disulfide interchange protein DsbD homolog [Aliiglaciecola lipolytica E3]|uniref:Thiol-disulfide interchange protein DsbD homolog n=2 Tax=Aliiglaciecola TaxID=1406885 RepID=K6X5Y9_9ALTE|nr:thiol-disulfide interchange protein DsbD homolog [Aliiglaciecola lipolytica E3]
MLKHLLFNAYNFQNMKRTKLGLRRGYRISLWLFVFVLFSPSSWGQETAQGDHVNVRWLAPTTFASGQTQYIGFYFEVDPEWHVYWRNAGDSGAAPRFDSTVQGAQIGQIQWPFPQRLPVAHLTNLGYEGNVAYLLPVTPDNDADTVSLSVSLEWLVCKIDCIPGFGQMSLSRPVTENVQWQAHDKEIQQHFVSRLPQSATQSPWKVQSLAYAKPSGTHITLTLMADADETSTPRVFPLSGDLISATEPQLQRDAQQLKLTFALMPGAQLVQQTDFVITDGSQAWHLANVPIIKSQGNDNSFDSPETQSIWVLLLAAFAGGIILNLMPCLFPVLSIKLFGLMQAQSSTRVYEGLAYTAGVLVTFAALGGLLLLLRASGSAIGWGFQLQSAPVVLSLILLFWLMALSFSGFFDFGHRLMNLAGSHRSGAFVTGMLAVFVATPCTGPFMGVALGAAAVLPAMSALMLFLALGAGLAAPFLLLCLWPWLLTRLPRPGAWMETLRQFLAFPLYATVIWLLWVLGKLVGDAGWVIGCLLMLSIVFAIWIASKTKRLGKWTAIAIALFVLIYSFVSIQVENNSATTVAKTDRWHAFDPVKIEEALQQEKAVFVDYTAAWCITCQVNKKLVLENESVLKLFDRNDVLLIRADWTHHDPAITESLSQFGRNSVPVYAWYAKGTNNAELLPQILTVPMIENLFEESH